jgi:hypothetical protein
LTYFNGFVMMNRFRAAETSINHERLLFQYVADGGLCTWCTEQVYLCQLTI